MLRSRNLPPQIAMQSRKGGGGYEYWEVRTSNAIVVDLGLDGEWTIAMYWRYRDPPGGANDAILVDSSISLNVRHDLVASDRSACLVRYDVERLRDLEAARGPHVQTFQFDPIFDRVHYATVGLPPDFEWDTEGVLDFLTEVLPADLADKGWPPA